MAALLLTILTFVELNCENLFDTERDSLKQDTEYLPESPRRWTRTRYWKKLDNISRAVVSCGRDSAGWELPGIVALCEVENDTVMRDLTQRSLLRNARYEYVITDSPDVRGIDVALMYSPFSFSLMRHYALRVEPLKGMRPTRDILYACGRVINGDTLHIFIVHAPSRYSGERLTRSHRLQVMRRLKTSIDSLRNTCGEPSIIIAGDLNDNDDSPSLKYLSDDCGMTDVSAGCHGAHGAKASYKYKGGWNSFDHILVSGGLLASFIDCRVHDPEFLLEDDKKYGGIKPFRTYYGYRFQNGYSDHLPLVARFNVSPHTASSR